MGNVATSCEVKVGVVQGIDHLGARSDPSPSTMRHPEECVLATWMALCGTPCSGEETTSPPASTITPKHKPLRDSHLHVRMTRV